ncbi:MAG: DUF1134 domain-containing protein [Gammaproteobacteria bacterium]|nr:DUF1134 domain-containing protein [Gammaproteobacteria bacterium]MDE2250289.1 DUF1134 domain-containing protein [Gammaproteobacteria bacterium]
MLALSAALAAVPLARAASAPATHATYSDDEVTRAANDFFKNGAQDLGKVLQKVLKEKGQPVAIIRGEEVGGAVGVGLRYGHGELDYKGAGGQKIYWQGPSLGFDLGANAVKVFALVYDLPSSGHLFRRFPGVDGSLYFVGGFGVNYVQNGDTVIAPVRFGVGWRQGINVGYMHFSAKKRLNPF